MSGLRTLGEFIVEKQADFPHASGDLSSLLASIRLAAKIVNREINAAGLGDITGAVGTENVKVKTSKSSMFTRTISSKPRLKLVTKCVALPVRKKTKRLLSTKSSTKTPNMWY